MPELFEAGRLQKMAAALNEPVSYGLRLDDQTLPLNDLMGRHIELNFTGAIFCHHCGRKTNKSFSQGYCYPCFKSLAQCDICIVSPEKCHYSAGTCREPEWGDTHCMIEHVVYLANSSGIKVGITRHSQVPTRWIDQGAVQALPILRVQTRQQSGLVEAALRQHVSDRTNWRAMLKGNNPILDLPALRDDLLQRSEADIGALQQQFGVQAVQPLLDAQVTEIHYPVEQYPDKIVSPNPDKEPRVAGTLHGIKGQYLLLDTGVINLRKFTAYQVEFSVF